MTVTPVQENRKKNHTDHQVTVQHERKTRHHAEEDTNAKNSFTFPKKQQQKKKHPEFILQDQDQDCDPRPEPEPEPELLTARRTKQHSLRVAKTSASIFNMFQIEYRSQAKYSC